MPIPMKGFGQPGAGKKLLQALIDQNPIEGIEKRGIMSPVVKKVGTANIPPETTPKAVGGINVYYHGSVGEIDRWGIADSMDLGVHFGTKEQAFNRVQKGGRGSGTLNIVEINIPEERIIDIPDIFNRIGWPSGSPYADIVNIFDARINFKWYDRAGLLERAKRADDLVDLDTGRGDWNDEKPVLLFWKKLRGKLKDYGYDAVRYENKVEGGGESIVVLDPRKTRIKNRSVEEISELQEQPSKSRHKNKYLQTPDNVKKEGIPSGIVPAKNLIVGRDYTIYSEKHPPHRLRIETEREAEFHKNLLNDPRIVITESLPNPSRPPKGGEQLLNALENPSTLKTLVPMLGTAAALYPQPAQAFGEGQSLLETIAKMGTSAPIGANLSSWRNPQMAEKQALQEPLVDPTVLLGGPARWGGGVGNMIADSLMKLLMGQ